MLLNSVSNDDRMGDGPARSAHRDTLAGDTLDPLHRVDRAPGLTLDLLESASLGRPMTRIVLAMSTRRTICAIAPGAAIAVRRTASLCAPMARPDAALILGGLLLLICP